MRYYPEDEGNGALNALRESSSILFDAKRRVVLFDGLRAHSVTSFNGDRGKTVLVFFNSDATQTAVTALGQASATPSCTSRRPTLQAALINFSFRTSVQFGRPTRTSATTVASFALRAVGPKASSQCSALSVAACAHSGCSVAACVPYKR